MPDVLHELSSRPGSRCADSLPALHRRCSVFLAGTVRCGYRSCGGARLCRDPNRAATDRRNRNGSGVLARGHASARGSQPCAGLGRRRHAGDGQAPPPAAPVDLCRACGGVGLPDRRDGNHRGRRVPRPRYADALRRETTDCPGSARGTAARDCRECAGSAGTTPARAATRHGRRRDPRSNPQLAAPHARGRLRPNRQA